jgi:tetratricopeptide (TPR) repeat protein
MAHYCKKGWLVAVPAAVLLATASLATAAPIAWEGIDDPHIRAAQFDLLRGDPFAAITQLKADLQQGLIKQRPEQAQLALGGMYLAYGAHHRAAEIFTRLGESGQSQEVRNLAWQQLAQVQYQRGLADEALVALGRIRGELPVEEQQERLLLAGMLLMQRQRFDEAIAVLRQLGKKSLVQQLSEKSVWATYGRFNLGVSLFQQGNEKEGRQLLEELGTAEAHDAEGQALRDKANLTLAYHALSQEDPDLAQRYFIKTRLQGPLSSKALLGLGRAYSAKSAYKKALVPWLKLIKRDASDVAVQDGMLAVPFAFGKLNAYKQALQYYQAALGSFKDEMEQVRLAETAINSGVLVDNLARTVGGQDVQERWLLKQLPDDAGGRYLWPLFATNEFQETLKNYAQMRLSLGRLEQWSSEIDDSKDMAPQQRRQFEARIGRLQGKLVAMVERLRSHLQQLALNELARRKQRLVGYAGEARFSMAQIYDYAAKRWGGGQ